MNSAPSFEQGQGQHINRPLLLNGQHYSRWKGKNGELYLNGRL